ncbi:hypothetical protein D3C81_1452860 [compost metagenome]
MVIHIALWLLAVNIKRQGFILPVNDGSRIEVRFIHPTRQIQPETPAASTESIRARPRVEAKTRPHATSHRPLEATAPEQSHSTRENLNLSIDVGGARPEFRRDIFTRKNDASHFVPAKRLRLVMQDTTLMGRISEMSRRADCAELARALQSNKSSADSILASMQSRGCGR